MSNDQIDDLKQFITATVSQTEARMLQRMGELIGELEKKVDDGFMGVGEAIEIIHGLMDSQSKKDNQRFAHLEHKATFK